jgi:hypothetical protein
MNRQSRYWERIILLREVYLVSSGAYSDYSVYAAALTPELAQKIADRANGKHFEPGEEGYGYRVEPFPLVDDIEDVIVRTMYHIAIDGNGAETQRTEWIDAEFTVAPSGAHGWGGKFRQGAFCTSPRGFEVALKGARDALAMAKAEQTDIAIPEEEI